MKRIIYIVLLIAFMVFLPVSAFSEEWDVEDKLLLGGLITTNFIDYKQTSFIFDHPEERKELNPVIVEGVDKYGKSFVPLYFVAATLVEAFIADKLKSKHRGIFLGFTFGSSFSAVYFNYRAGIKIEF